MNLEQWLRARREGILAAMPLGMNVAMGACGDRREIYIGGLPFECGNGDSGNVYWISEGQSLCYGYGDYSCEVHMNPRGDGYGDGDIMKSGYGCLIQRLWLEKS